MNDQFGLTPLAAQGALDPLQGDLLLSPPERHPLGARIGQGAPGGSHPDPKEKAGESHCRPADAGGCPVVQSTVHSARPGAARACGAAPTGAP